MSMTDDAVFESAHNALLFAFNFSDQQYDRPMMNKMASGPMQGVSKGLSGMDGAAQAGMIISRLMQLPDLYQYIIFAQYAPQTIACGCRHPCCSGHKANVLWNAAVNEVSMAALTQALSGCVSHRMLRDGIVKKLFERKTTKTKIVLSELADRCGVPERTALDQSAKVRRWYYGTQGGKDKAQVEGQRVIAEKLIDSALSSCGITKALD